MDRCFGRLAIDLFSGLGFEDVSVDISLLFVLNAHFLFHLIFNFYTKFLQNICQCAQNQNCITDSYETYVHLTDVTQCAADLEDPEDHHLLFLLLLLLLLKAQEIQ